MTSSESEIPPIGDNESLPDRPQTPSLEQETPFKLIEEDTRSDQNNHSVNETEYDDGDMGGEVPRRFDDDDEDLFDRETDDNKIVMDSVEANMSVEFGKTKEEGILTTIGDVSIRLLDYDVETEATKRGYKNSTEFVTKETGKQDMVTMSMYPGIQFGLMGDRNLRESIRHMYATYGKEWEFHIASFPWYIYYVTLPRLFMPVQYTPSAANLRINGKAILEAYTGAYTLICSLYNKLVRRISEEHKFGMIPTHIIPSQLIQNANDALNTHMIYIIKSFHDNTKDVKDRTSPLFMAFVRDTLLQWINVNEFYIYKVRHLMHIFDVLINPAKDTSDPSTGGKDLFKFLTPVHFGSGLLSEFYQYIDKEELRLFTTNTRIVPESGLSVQELETLKNDTIEYYQCCENQSLMKYANRPPIEEVVEVSVDIQKDIQVVIEEPPLVASSPELEPLLPRETATFEKQLILNERLMSGLSLANDEVNDPVLTHDEMEEISKASRETVADEAVEVIASQVASMVLNTEI